MGVKRKEARGCSPCHALVFLSLVLVYEQKSERMELTWFSKYMKGGSEVSLSRGGSMWASAAGE